MRDLIKTTLIETARIGLGVLVCVSIVGSVAYAANLIEPTATPPGVNTPAPVNVTGEYQEKTGDFWADSVGSTDGFCIGASCITSWPSGAAPSTCQLNTMIREDHRPLSMGTGCIPSSQEAAAGWTLVSWDECSSVRSSDCAGPYYCVYQQVSCTGSVTIEAGTVTQTTLGGGDGGGGGGCFSPETRITMADGSMKQIRDIQVGEYVLSADEDGSLLPNQVTQTFIHSGKNETLIVNGSIVVTPIHPIKTQNGWVTASELQIGDTLYTESSTLKVTSVTPGPTLPAVYNLEVEPTHTYFAEGVLVHNKLDVNQN